MGLHDLIIPPSCMQICAEAFASSELKSITTQSNVEFERNAFSYSTLCVAYLNGVLSLTPSSFFEARNLEKIFALELRYICAKALWYTESLSEIHLKIVPKIVSEDAFLLSGSVADRLFPAIFIPKGSNKEKFRDAFAIAYQHATNKNPSTMKIVFE